MPSIVVISPRDSDAAFGYGVAKFAEMGFVHVTRNSNLVQVINEEKNIVVLWDTDHPDVRSNPNHQLALSKTYQILRSQLSERRIMVMSSTSLTKNPKLFKLPVFSHYIKRPYNKIGAILTSRIVGSLCQNSYFGLERYMPDQSKIQTVRIHNTQERFSASKALENVLRALKIPSRLSHVAVSATEELILNAMIRAPIRNGYRYRAQADMSGSIPLEEKEKIDLEIGFCESYVGLCIRDNFGSLKKEMVHHHLSKDYENIEYTLASKRVPNGLGIYEVAKSGLSFLFAVSPDQKTEAFLFIPKVKAFKSFRSATQIFGFL